MELLTVFHTYGIWLRGGLFFPFFDKFLVLKIAFFGPNFFKNAAQKKIPKMASSFAKKRYEKFGF